LANVLLGVTGSVAAVRTPALFESLRARGHAVRIVSTRAATYFFDPAAIAPKDDGSRDPAIVSLDEDEWPGRDQGRLYARGDEVLHIDLRRWADLFLIAPLDANTLAKLAAGICDNCLTCVWRAWDLTRPVIVAPAMNTMMWEHPLTQRHLQQLAAMAGADFLGPFGVGMLIDQMSAIFGNLCVVPPISKQLACGDVGMGGLADVESIVECVERKLKQSR